MHLWLCPLIVTVPCLIFFTPVRNYNTRTHTHTHIHTHTQNMQNHHTNTRRTHKHKIIKYSVRVVQWYTAAHINFCSIITFLA